MRNSIKKAIGDTVQGLIKSGAKTSFSAKDLKELGINIPEVKMTAEDIKEIREKANMSQSVFAKVLNVNSSSVKQWEQGKRNPSGSTKVLLELLKMNPDILNYRVGLKAQAEQA